MDLDEFKLTWQAYDRKLDQTQRLGQHLLNVIQRNRSENTIDKMIRELRLSYVILIGIILIFSAIVIGNPFDYTQSVHFIPALCYTIIAIVGLFFSIRHHNSLRQTTLSSHNLYQALTELIGLREQHTRLMSRVWVMGMLAGAMIMLPNIARRYSDAGWVSTVLLVLCPVGVAIASAWLAKKIGLFTDHHLGDLREQAKELEEINVTVAE